MALHDQLLQQARDLAQKERGRPQQASLRRAVSTAYYSLFHFLVAGASRSFVGAASSNRQFRAIMGRAFSHNAMKQASESFGGGTLPASLRRVFPNTAIPADLRRIAETFATLQVERHKADYDLSVQFVRYHVTPLIDRVETAIRLWPRHRNTIAGRLYLLSLLLWDRWRSS